MKSAAGLVIVLSFTGLISACGGPSNSSSSSAGSGTPSPTPVVTPAARAFAAMAYDQQIGKLVMYGGATAFGQVGDTWGWDGKGWSLLSKATDQVTQNPVMADDPTSRHLYLFGTVPSAEIGTQVNVVSAWKSAGWSQVYSWNTPLCGKSCPGSLGKPFGVGNATYVSALGKVVMLSGGPGGPGDETWSWDGSSWTQLPTVHRPMTVGCCPVYDANARQLVSVGYTGIGWGGVNRTWIFDGTDWQVSPASTPNGMDISTVEDPSGSGVLLILGAHPGISALETWRWDGHSWQRLDSNGPPDTPGFAVGADPATKQVVLFGGRDAYGQLVGETWTWNGHTWQKRSGSS